jgi:hypothetical protein
LPKLRRRIGSSINDILIDILFYLKIYFKFI